jgi:hypothetical protein
MAILQRPCGDPKAKALSHNLLKLWPALLTFAMVSGAKPTNNRAERARTGQYYGAQSKGFCGNQSDNCSRFTERILTTVATLRQQSKYRGICCEGYPSTADWSTCSLSPTGLYVDGRRGLKDYGERIDK